MKDDTKNSWIRTYTGGKIYLFDPIRSSIEIEDVAHTLAMLCRFNGASKQFYSIAQHCCIICDNLPDHLKFDGLMHDSGEIAISDIPSPFKAHFPELKKAEIEFEGYLSGRFGFNFPYDPLVKVHDVKCLATEMRDLMVRDDQGRLDQEPYKKTIKPWGWKRGKREFMDRYYKHRKNQ